VVRIPLLPWSVSSAGTKWLGRPSPAPLFRRNTPSMFTAVCRRQSANHISIALHMIPIPAFATINVQTAKAPLGGFHHARPALLEAHVLMKIDRLAAAAGNLVDHRLASCIVQVGYHHLALHAPAWSRRPRQFPTRRPLRWLLCLYLPHNVLLSYRACIGWPSTTAA